MSLSITAPSAAAKNNAARGRRRRHQFFSKLLRVLCEVAAQLVDRGKAQYALRQFRFDRTVDIKRVAHAVDHTRFQDRDRLRASGIWLLRYNGFGWQQIGRRLITGRALR